MNKIILIFVIATFLVMSIANANLIAIHNSTTNTITIEEIGINSNTLGFGSSELLPISTFIIHNATLGQFLNLTFQHNLTANISAPQYPVWSFTNTITPSNRTQFITHNGLNISIKSVPQNNSVLNLNYSRVLHNALINLTVIAQSGPVHHVLSVINGEANVTINNVTVVSPKKVNKIYNILNGQASISNASLNYTINPPSAASAVFSFVSNVVNQTRTSNILNNVSITIHVASIPQVNNVIRLDYNSIYDDIYTNTIVISPIYPLWSYTNTLTSTNASQLSRTLQAMQ